MINFDNIKTETRNSLSNNLDSMNALEIITLMNEEDVKISKAIKIELEKISEIVEKAALSISNGGRIIYLGAGTSGRLGVLDAVECPPTFGVSDEVVIGLIAGGEKAFVKAQEGAEDDPNLAKKDLLNLNLCDKDIVIGIAASGRTPYVVGGLMYANALGCVTGSIAITTDSEIGKVAQYPIEVVVGPEIITGSTRLKAGTAQKMILNMISTGVMVLNGKVYQNLMVDVVQTNEKLKVRAQNIVIEATGVKRVRAMELLEQSNGSAKIAIAMELTGWDVMKVVKSLELNNGSLRKVLNI